MKKIFTTLASSFLLLSIAGTANAIIIDREYNDPDGSGSVTYNDLGGNQLEISIDNTTPSFSSIITGLVFDILADIQNASYQVFDGDNNDITQFWGLAFNTSGNITPGNTEVDLYFDSTLGINGGIYNGECVPVSPGDCDTSGAYTDIARMVLDITEPVPWALAEDGISGDFLRMQRTGSDGEGSLKIPGEPGGGEPPGGVPVPGTVFLLGLGLLGLARSRRMSR